MRQPGLQDAGLLVVGAGPTGCVVAREAADYGWRVQIVERRSHIAGNCFDEAHPADFYIHRYGPHYFRTENESVFKYLSRFTTWIDGTYRAQAVVGGKQYTFPINLNILEDFFGQSFDEKSARDFITRGTVPNSDPKNAEEYRLRNCARCH